MDPAFERARALFVAGIDAFESTRYAEADSHFEASLQLLPGRISTLNNLAATRIRLMKTSPRRIEAARPACRHAWWRSTLRYAHSEPYLRRLAERNGFAIDQIDRRPVREDRHQPIPGLFVYLTKRQA